MDKILHRDENTDMLTAEEPFPLEITPEKLVVPPDGVLEVKIKNPTDQKYEIIIYFNSFYFLMQLGDRDIMENRMSYVKEEMFIKTKGCSISSLCAGQILLPGQTLTLKIGYLGGKFTGKKFVLNDVGAYVDEVDVDVDAAPHKRIFYNYERPEGSIRFLLTDFIVFRDMPLFLEEDTSQYKKFKEQFDKIRKDQERRARWGHVLVNQDNFTLKKYKDDAGNLHDSARINEINFPDFAYEATRKGYEDDILTDLEEIDKLSDEEIRVEKERRRRKIEDDLKKKRQTLDEEELAEIQKLELRSFKKEIEEVNEVKTEEVAALKKSSQKVSTKHVQKPTQKPLEVQKPSELKVTDTPKSNIQKTKQKELTVKKPVEEEKKRIKQVKKKKKANPCCIM